jgi:hypothetical protein
MPPGRFSMMIAWRQRLSSSSPSVRMKISLMRYVSRHKLARRLGRTARQGSMFICSDKAAPENSAL